MVFLVKADDVSIELLEEFEIPTSPVFFRGKLLKTNIPIIWSSEQLQTHDTCTKCNLCKNGFSKENRKVADHSHLSGHFRQTLCNTCNLKLQTPNFVPCFFHNFSNYDACYGFYAQHKINVRTN
ncbi:hypothetical protein QTP88_028925 [Uroleucon formosanum]